MPMSATPWIIISIVILLVLLAIIAFLFKNKKKTPTDYYTLYLMGIIWMIIGIPLENYALSAVGLVLAIIGAKNKDKWKKNRKCWKNMDEKEKKLHFTLILISVILLIIGIVVYFIFALR